MLPEAPRSPDDLTQPWRAVTPIAFVAIALIVLVIIPMLVVHRTGALRAERAEVIEPARELVDRIESAIAQGVAARRGLLLTGDSAFLARYRVALRRQDEAQAALQPLARRLGPEVERRTESLRQIAGYWHGTEAELLSRLGSEEGDDTAREQQELYEETMAAAGRLRDAVVQSELTQRREITEVERLGSIATIVLVLVSLAALLLLARVAHGLFQQARFDRDLRRLSHELAGSVELKEIAERVSAGARRLSGAHGAWVELPYRGGEGVEIVAAEGIASPLLGTRVPGEGSVPGPEARTARLRGPDLAEPSAGLLASLDPDIRMLAATLTQGGQRFGALVVLRRQRRFGDGAVKQMSLLQDLASLAIRKAVLFDEAATRREEAEELLEVKARLIRGISHDLKNPLGAADGYAYLLESGIAGELSEQQRDYVGRIRRVGSSMEAIIEDLLRFSDPDVGELEIRVEPTDLGAVVRQTAEDYRAAFDAAELELRVAVADGLPRILTDGRRVGEIVGNLLSNAAKFTPSGGLVRLSVREPSGEGTVAVDVEDTGPGVPEHQREHIFEEYSRLDPERSPGSGLGLAISRSVAGMLGGDLVVDAANGGGARFTLLLPADAAPDQGDGRPPQS